MNNTTPNTTKIIIGVLVVIILCLAVYITSQPRMMPMPGNDNSNNMMENDDNGNGGDVSQNSQNSNTGGSGSSTVVPTRPGAVMTKTPVKNPLASTVWTWKSTSFTNKSTTVAPNNEKFVIRFGADGKVSSVTDCNSVAGTYTISSELLKFGALASTRMACQGPTLEMDYTNYLSQVESYQIVGSQLHLNLAKNAGMMSFTRKLN
ncbi:MAG: META domain-containing protein [Patescibacteria group bacterium]